MGISLPPLETSLYQQASLSSMFSGEKFIDIRNREEFTRAIQESNAQVAFHLAAQPLVRRSYRDPIDTWSTNVMGTANVLEACRHQASVKAVIVVTTDKCYENQDWAWGYRENDPLGGHDPYSASKAATEHVAASYRSSFFHFDSSPLLATARAGNVIGGGDWSEDRLIPDLIRAIDKAQSLEIRAPQATRPWQHVLESLSGYLLLGQKLLGGEKSCAEAWNFGPEREGNRSVSEVLTKLKGQWETLCWHVTDQPQPHEANLLYLDSAKARSKLGWQPVWNLDVTLEKTAEWYRAWLLDKAIISRRQLADYLEAAADAGIEWAKP
jgi:CDP-glucose 4,6-dehydratase